MPDFTQESSDVAVRFHRDAEWYIVSTIDDVQVLRVWANSERVVELFYRLSAQLDPVVDVVLSDRRAGCTWVGALRFLPEGREAIGRLRWPLATYGGVEGTLVNADDQLSLTPTLELVIYARHDRWRAALEGDGVMQRETPPRALWSPGTTPWGDAPELDAAIAVTVERLALEAES
jgi:hypothetical protein